jgi:hypothetical protein
METLSKHFRDITKAAFARHGFAQADVVGHWADIVGEDLAAVSAPDRIKWPRQENESSRKTGGTLVVRATPGRAIDLQYEGPRIIARINSFFGYGAVAQIKVIQSANVARKGPGGPRHNSGISVPDQTLEEMADSPLKTALTRLGQGVAVGRRSSPQQK